MLTVHMIWIQGSDGQSYIFMCTPTDGGHSYNLRASNALDEAIASEAAA